MLGDLFQVVVRGILVYEDQVVNRDAYLERINKKKEAYKNMTESERYMHDIKTIFKGFHT